MRHGCTPEFLAQILEDMPQQRTQTAGLRVSKAGDYTFRPYIDVLDETTGKIVRKQKRLRIGNAATMKARDAKIQHKQALDEINQSRYLITSQIPLDTLVARYKRECLPKLAASTQGKYLAHIDTHILTGFVDDKGRPYKLYQMTPDVIQSWLDSKERSHASSTRTDMRNVLSALFTAAIRWGWWREANPVEYCTAGPAQPVRETRKLTVEQTRAFLDALRPDVQLICETALFTGLRISEVLGLQWQDFDPQTGALWIRRRYYRGNVSTTKSKASQRVVPLGSLAEKYSAMEPGHKDQFIFAVTTKYGVTRDDRSIRRYFFRPAAEAVGIYTEGFGFHALRREACTEYDRTLEGHQATKLVGHTRQSMTGRYVQRDFERQKDAVIQFQAKVWEEKKAQQRKVG